MGPLVLRNMAREEAVHLLRRQEYLDEVSSLDLPSSYAAWYNVDVATLLNKTRIAVSYTHLTLPTSNDV